MRERERGLQEEEETPAGDASEAEERRHYVQRTQAAGDVRIPRNMNSRGRKDLKEMLLFTRSFALPFVQGKRDIDRPTDLLPLLDQRSKEPSSSQFLNLPCLAAQGIRTERQLSGCRQQPSPAFRVQMNACIRFARQRSVKFLII